jgi:hypothetical protein
MKMGTEDKPLPVENWGLFKLILAPLALFGIWALIIIFFPQYSPIALAFGLLLLFAGIAGFILVGYGYRRLGQIGFSNALYLSMFALSARHWMSILDNLYLWGVWMAVLFSIYVFAWMLPRYNPKLSEFLVREQYTPETSMGKIILNASAKFLPIAGASGALFGMYASRDGNYNFATLFVAIAFSLVSIAFAQLTAHQFWMEDQQKAQSEERS